MWGMSDWPWLIGSRVETKDVQWWFSRVTLHFTLEGAANSAMRCLSLLTRALPSSKDDPFSVSLSAPRFSAWPGASLDPSLLCDL